MAKKLSRRGQKLSQKISRFSRVASEASQEHIKENLVEKLPHARNVRLLILEWSLLMSVLILLAITQAFWYSDSNATNSLLVAAPTPRPLSARLILLTLSQPLQIPKKSLVA